MVLSCSGKWRGIVASFEGGAPRTATYGGTYFLVTQVCWRALSISWSCREALQHFRLKGKSICGETLQYLKIDSQSHPLVLFCKNLGGLLAGTKQGCRLLSIPRVLNHACRITV